MHLLSDHFLFSVPRFTGGDPQIGHSKSSAGISAPHPLQIFFQMRRFAFFCIMFCTGIFRWRQTFCTAKSSETTVPERLSPSAITEISVSESTRKSPDRFAASRTFVTAAGSGSEITSPLDCITSNRIFEVTSLSSATTSGVVANSPQNGYSPKKKDASNI